MDRRRFLQNLAATAAAANTLAPAVAEAQRAAAGAAARPSRTRGPVDVEGHTVVCKFTTAFGRERRGARHLDGLRGPARARRRDHLRGIERRLARADEERRGELRGRVRRRGVAPYLGLKIEDIGMSGRDLLAEKLLAHGDDPDPAQVMAAAPPQGSAPADRRGARALGDVRGHEGGVRRHAGLSGRVDADVPAVAVLRGAARAHPESGQRHRLSDGAESAPLRRAGRRLDARDAHGHPARARHARDLHRARDLRRRAPEEGQVHHPDVAPLDEDREREDREGGVRRHLRAVSAGAEASRSRGVLSRAARVRRLLGRAARRPRARDAAGSIVGRPDVALLRQGADDPSRRRLAEIRRGRSRLLRQRIRRLPGHLHQRALHQPRMGTLRHRAPVPRRLLHELRRAERDDQHARAGNGSVRADAAGPREILPLHARRGARSSNTARRSKRPRRSSPTCTTSRSRCRRTIRNTG